MRNFLFITTLVTVGMLYTSCEKNTENNNSNQEVKTSWSQSDYNGVKAAIEDYVEGLYQVDSTRIEKSVDTTLRKLGYWYNPKKKEFMDNLPMSYDRLVRLAARWNKDGKSVKENSPKKIEIYDVNSKTASAKLTAEWGIDYFHLGKVNDQWKIFNIIWQSMPEKE